MTPTAPETPADIVAETLKLYELWMAAIDRKDPPLSYVGIVREMALNAETLARRLQASEQRERAYREALENIKRFGELASVTIPNQGYTGGKKPASKEVWQFPRHMLTEVDAALALKVPQTGGKDAE